jgi:hypothetical protein
MVLFFGIVFARMTFKVEEFQSRRICGSPGADVARH